LPIIDFVNDEKFEVETDFFAISFSAGFFFLCLHVDQLLFNFWSTYFSTRHPLGLLVTVCVQAIVALCCACGRAMALARCWQL
jgi:hypothetical protein